MIPLVRRLVDGRKGQNTDGLLSACRVHVASAKNDRRIRKMEQKKDIVERLRSMRGWHEPTVDELEAASEIERLRAEIEARKINQEVSDAVIENWQKRAKAPSSSNSSDQ